MNSSENDAPGAGTTGGDPVKDLKLFKEHHWVVWVKVGADILSLQLALQLGCFFRNSVLGAWRPWNLRYNQCDELMFALLLVPLGYWLLGLYPGYGLTGVERLRRRIRATVVLLMLFICWDFVAHHATSPRGIILSTFAFALLIPPIIQSLLRNFLIRMECWGTPVVVLGAARIGRRVVQSLLKDPTMGFHPVLFFDDDPKKAGTKVHGIPIVHGLLRANEFAGSVKYALLAIPEGGEELQLELWRKLRFRHVVIIPNLFGIQSLWVEARDLGGIIGLEIQKKLLVPRNMVYKQLLDYALGIPLFLLSIPILTALAVLIMIASPGNPFYCQVREGYGGKKIRVWKLRTMYKNADRLLLEYLERNPEAKQEWRRYFKLKDDPRILRGIGSILRKTSLDELPQLWNVLRGEMSLVGPRPFPHYHLEQFENSFREMRRSVKPGITGLWQVSARSDGDLAAQESFDTYYIRNWSVWLDLSLLGRTVLVVLIGKGAY
jgi:Undecaprenyl-phosphate galactose phosphotransferase WbaP